MTTPFDPPTALETIQRVLDSAEGQTPLGARLAPMIRQVQNVMTAKNIHCHVLSEENDQLNKEVFTLKSENDQLKQEVFTLKSENDQLKQEVLEINEKSHAAHMQHLKREEEWAKDMERGERRKIKKLAGEAPDARKRRRTGGSDGAGTKP